MSAVLEVRDAGRTFRQSGVLRTALDGVTFRLEAGRTLAVVGESGAGKTTLTRLVAGLERPSSGSVSLLGREPRPRPGRPSPVQIVFQSPAAGFNPLFPVGWSIAEAMGGEPRAGRAARVADLMRQVGLDPERARDRPSTFSGGQLQRIALARALAAAPKLLICDEPTSALDVSVQGQILNLLLELQPEWGFATLLVTHDLGVARVLADDVLVLRDGKVVELAPADAFFAGPADAYSRSLLDAATQHVPDRHDETTDARRRR